MVLCVRDHCEQLTDDLAVSNLKPIKVSANVIDVAVDVFTLEEF